MSSRRSPARSLNPQQRDAVRYLDSPLLVLAGAGSGKTSVITEKISYLIKQCDYAPENIAAVTFTNKAAREMKERVSKLVGAELTQKLSVSTFHNLGLRVIRQEIKHLPLRHGFTIFDSEDCQTLLKELLLQSSLDNKLLDIAQHTISNWKNNLVTPEQALQLAKTAGEQSLASTYGRYLDALKAYNAVDFDDLIGLPVKLLQENDDVLHRWREQIRYLLVDEYQDTNSSQYRLVQLLMGDRNGLTAVGDDDQSIYAWRGAKPENLAQLQQDFPTLRLIKLEQNYRSTERILHAANSLIKNNPHHFEKKLWSELGSGEPLRVLQLDNEDEETERIATEIIQQQLLNKTRYRDFAILYRGNHQSRLLELKLQQHRIPYAVSGGTSFFARQEVKDIMAYLRLLANPDDDSAFLRIINIPRRAIGPTTLEKLGEFAQHQKAHQHCSLYSAIEQATLGDTLKADAVAKLRDFKVWLDGIRQQCHQGDAIAAIREMISDMGYELWLRQNSSSPEVAARRMENVDFLIDSVKQMLAEDTNTDTQHDAQDKISNAIAKLVLQDLLEQQEEEDQTNRVQLMTLHAAKGLEFPHVFMMGMEENLLPHRNSIDGKTIEEERRLAYVGITRARLTLTFTLARERKQYGERVTSTPSRFLAELPEEDLQWEGKTASTAESKQQKASATLASLKNLLNSG